MPDAALRAAAAHVFVPSLDADALELAPDDAHHLARVLRLRPGQAVTASDGRGRWRACRFTGRASAPLDLVGEVTSEAEPQPAVTVGVSLVKGERLEWAVQKLTELGVDRVLLLRSARGVVRWDDDRAARHLARLERIAREAAQQSRRVWLPTVDGPVATADVPRADPRVVVADPAAPAGLTDVAHTVLVGPEGGWEADEVDGRGAVSLGGTVLRTETAAVAAGVLLMALRSRLVRSADRSP